MELQLIRPIEWKEMFEIWGRGESQLPHWIEYYKKQGFASWEEWRSDSVKNLHPEKHEWKLYSIPKLEIVLEFYTGPFRSWREKYYDGKFIIQFSEMAEKSALREDANIRELVENFPSESILFGIRKDGKIIIMDGMHRCCALALALTEGKTIKTSLQIALTEFEDELPSFGLVTSPT